MGSFAFPDRPTVVYASRISIFLLLLVLASVDAFEPFAGVAELSPRNLRDYCGKRNSSTGLADCSHVFEKTLEDGGKVELSWRMLVDPDRVLSVDTEHLNGVKVVGCNPEVLVLELPEDYVAFARKGTVVVASRFLDPCGHLAGKHLFCSVKEVDSIKWIDDGSSRKARATFVTTEFPDVSHIAQSFSFNFAYVPVEAQQADSSSAVQTDFGQNMHGCRTPPCDLSNYERRLDVVSSSTSGISTPDQMLRLLPKQIANFGWNWDFFMNSTQSPEFSWTLPGARGFIKLDKPFIRIHAGIFLNFSSELRNVLEPPHVIWKAGFQATGAINARMMVDSRTTGEVSDDAFRFFKVPVLSELTETEWFGKIDITAGVFPLSFEPGFQFNADIYHTGTFQGNLQVGGSTNFTLFCMADFDSQIGLRPNVVSEFRDLELFPPIMVSHSDKLDMGFMMSPTLWIRGQFGGTRRDAPISSEIGFELRPYLNYSVSRGNVSAVLDAQVMKSLVVYPFKVIGLPIASFHKQYSVEVSVSGMTARSRPTGNWAEMNIHDNFNLFNLGRTPSSSILRQTISVKIIETDLTNPDKHIEKELGSGTGICSAIVSGVCHLDPKTIRVRVSDNRVVDVMLIAVWKTNPTPWFASRIRGVSLAIPSLTIDATALVQAVPALARGTPTEKLYLHIPIKHRTYVVEVSGTSPNLRGDTVIELGPVFLESLNTCGLSECLDAPMQFYYGTTLIGAAVMPTIPWTSLPELVKDEGTGSTGLDGLSMMDLLSPKSNAADAQSMVMSWMLNTMMSVGSTGEVPPHVNPMFVSIGRSGSVSVSGHSLLGAVHIDAIFTDPMSGSAFVQPSEPMRISFSDSSTTFVWTTAYVQQDIEYTFTLTPWRRTSITGHSSVHAGQTMVGNYVMEELTNNIDTFTARCEQAIVAGIPAGALPCSFSHLMTFEAPTYAVGQQIIIAVQWTEKGFSHIIESPPVELVASSRRLISVPPPYRRLLSQQPSCQEEDLHFAIGVGMSTSVVLQTSSIPKYLPVVGGASSAKSLLSTGLADFGHGPSVEVDLREILPDWLCVRGVCSGTMPGCPVEHSTALPTIVYPIFNRNIMFSDLGAGRLMIQTALAYAFSVLPEVVDVVLEEVEETTTTTRSTTSAVTTQQVQDPWNIGVIESGISLGTPLPQDALASLIFGSVGLDTASSSEGTPVPTPAPGLGLTELPAMFQPPRRLRSTSVDASSELEAVEPATGVSSLNSRSVRVQFKKNPPFAVSQRLLTAMVQHQYFPELRDDLSEQGYGPLLIQDFQIQSGEGGSFHEDSQPAWHLLYTRSTDPSQLSTLFVGTLVCLVTLAAVFSFFAKSKLYDRLSADASCDVTDDEEDSSVREVAN